MKRPLAAALLLAASLLGQHVRVQFDKSVDFRAPRPITFLPGTIHGHHPRVDEARLRKGVEERILRHAAVKGLKESPRAPYRLTYSLSIREAVERQRRGGRPVSRDVTEYTLSIRLVDPSARAIWATTATGTVEELRHRYVEERVLRAVTLSMAKYPPAP